MSPRSYVLASLRHYRRIHAATAAGVAVATAVIVGALLVGDSVRGSLRELAVAGLGRIDAVLTAEQPFRQELAAEWAASPSPAMDRHDAVPLTIARGSLSARTADGGIRRAGRIELYGVTPEFWRLTPDGQPPATEAGELQLADGGVALAAEVAAELNVKPGDAVLLRTAVLGSMPTDSSLGEKEETVATRRLVVAAVFADDLAGSLGRFSLRPAQQAPRNAFLAMATLQELLGAPGKANAIVVAPLSAGESLPLSDEQFASIRAALRPRLADYGLKWDRVEIAAQPPVDAWRLSAERLVLPPAVASSIGKLLGERVVQPAVTYLANTIAAGERSIPYSTVTGVDSTAALGPLRDAAGAPIGLADDEVALNDWAANQLHVSVGDRVTLTYYLPETTHGQLLEGEPASLVVKAIVPLADEAGRPTAAADPSFAPELSGVTDEESIASWDLPFELVEEVRPQDETYWDERRTTPKAFVSHALAAKLWGSRWGADSVLRVAAADVGDGAALGQRTAAALQPAQMGLILQPVRRQVLDAAGGTTPFDGLFLGFSMFLLASAVMLVWLLFRLGAEGRIRDTGLLAALGLPRGRVRSLLLGEAAIVAVAGAALGVAAGIAYARLMIHGLNTWWVAATAAPFLRLHVSGSSLAVGFAAGVFVAVATMAWAVRRLLKLPPRQMLAGDVGDGAPPPSSRPRRGLGISLAPLVGVVALAVVALRSEGEARAGAFFGAGAMALLAELLIVRACLRGGDRRLPTSFNLAGLAMRSIRRNPGRSMLALALGACASFLLVALAAFRLAPSDRGVGGFSVLATAETPVPFDLAAAAGREQLGVSPTAEKDLVQATIVGLRVRDGEDASCLNLYQTVQPRLLGAPPERMAAVSRFAWGATAELPAAARKPSPKVGDAPPTVDSPTVGSPWLLLDADLGADAAGRPIVPMILDRNTAMYGLKLYGVGQQLTMTDSAGRPFTLQVVGLLANSVLQGDVVISEQQLLRLFPETAGRRLFLVAGAAVDDARLAELLETELEDFGLDAASARERLSELLAVQNTYLSTFQSLGALGLLLGAVGMAVVQLRSVAERRGELALLQATGFSPRRLLVMLRGENLVLLGGGLAMGAAAALAAVGPQAAVEQTSVPWRTLALLLGLIGLFGLAAGRLAARYALQAPLLPSLRGE